MKKTKLKLITISTKLIIMILFIMTASLLINSNTAYSKLTLRHYDDNGCSLDYRGVRVFKHPLRSTNKHIYNSWPYYIAYFDSRGLVKKYKYLKNGNVIYEERYIYANGRLAKVNFYQGVNQLVFTLHLLDSQNKTKKVYKRDKSYLISYFDSRKRLEKAELYNRKAKLITFTKFTYTKEDQIETQNFYDHNSRLIEYRQFYYHNGKKVKTASFSNNKKLISFTLFYYNGDNLLVKTEKYNSRKQLLEYSEYEYDDNGNFRYRLNYDRNGKLVIR